MAAVYDFLDFRVFLAEHHRDLSEPQRVVGEWANNGEGWASRMLNGDLPLTVPSAEAIVASLQLSAEEAEYFMRMVDLQSKGPGNPSRCLRLPCSPPSTFPGHAPRPATCRVARSTALVRTCVGTSSAMPGFRAGRRRGSKSASSPIATSEAANALDWLKSKGLLPILTQPERFETVALPQSDALHREGLARLRQQLVHAPHDLSEANVCAAQLVPHVPVRADHGRGSRGHCHRRREHLPVRAERLQSTRPSVPPELPDPAGVERTIDHDTPHNYARSQPARGLHLPTLPR